MHSTLATTLCTIAEYYKDNFALRTHGFRILYPLHLQGTRDPKIPLQLHGPSVVILLLCPLPFSLVPFTDIIALLLRMPQHYVYLDEKSISRVKRVFLYAVYDTLSIIDH